MDSNDAVDRYYRRIDEALARYSRLAPGRSYTWGRTPIPDFFGYDSSHGGQVDETSVLRSAAKHIEEDLKQLFRELPSSDHGPQFAD